MVDLRTILSFLLAYLTIWPLWSFYVRSSTGSRAVLSKSDSKAESQGQVRQCLKDTFYNGVRRDAKVYSQMGEDGIIESAFSCLKTTDKYYVEFGVEDGRECTTRLLRERGGWSGLMMDGSHVNQSINLQKEFMTSSNIVSLFQKHGVPKQYDFMTVDIDLNTFWVLQAILAAGYRPRLLNVEINRNFPATFKAYAVVNRPQAVWTQGCYFGASPLAYTRLAQFFGYRPLVFDQLAVNLFFVHTDSVGSMTPASSGNTSRVLQAAAAVSEDLRKTSTRILHPTASSVDGSSSSRTTATSSSHAALAMISDILLDPDFNLYAADRALPSERQGLRWPIHDGCSNKDWVHIPAHVNFSETLLDAGLAKIVLLESVKGSPDDRGNTCDGVPCTIRVFRRAKYLGYQGMDDEDEK
ncbi:hypothetical protein CEUSTIGMA_g822.t1 [Chlamydomonas eustigma]|uniref:Methyltransferase FkbM domain-containing protein n=1 Tax=Chlamydomonas eustigma TaxID=1157962 RepID=A0A250WRP4_9CHLO|nr:hypothetical protein CEUSTIGMA_g822.t1 [Chlamydomonas eustigma]|eukprot:GAX73369.1 hypothetical protein CEUSTIGMA_g822.t1 [Chlamydomonas eustigma]